MQSNPLYQQLFEQVVAERPELAQYKELFNQPQNSQSNEASDIQKDLLSRLKKTINTAKRLQEDLEEAFDELDDLAKALGACDCWGRDNRCPSCKGKGEPGYFKPEKELFNELILPALKQVDWLEVTQK